MNKLSWREPEEVNNLDTALVSLGYTYHIDTVPRDRRRSFCY